MLIVDIVAFSVLTAVLLAITILFIKTRLKVRKLYSSIIQLTLDKKELLVELSKALDALETKPLEQSDGFIKFLENSRESAFMFIELMQSAIADFEKETKDVFAKSELSDDIAKINLAYQKLKSQTLPDDLPNN